MYNYLAFFQKANRQWKSWQKTNSDPHINDNYMSVHYGCRETMLHDIVRYETASTDKTSPLYFGHVYTGSKEIQEAVSQNCMSICKDLWKDESISCDLVAVSSIQDCEATQNIRFYGDPLLVKVNKHVNPYDISLILWMGWYGSRGLRGHHRTYYIIKKCSELIPDIADPSIFLTTPYSWSNGPRSLMDNILYSSISPELKKEMLAVLNESKKKIVVSSTLAKGVRELYIEMRNKQNAT